jgi:hypothetical protein
LNVFGRFGLVKLLLTIIKHNHVEIKSFFCHLDQEFCEY